MHATAALNNAAILFTALLTTLPSLTDQNTGTRRKTTFRSTKDRIYDGGPKIL
jgi:hypothetical protein